MNPALVAQVRNLSIAMESYKNLIFMRDAEQEAKLSFANNQCAILAWLCL